ncbi:hypothetical protein PHYBOEH_004170 [Phytophthora boehmeriae]|uniref:EF-hand domain-containing protein n=1 Tax=Phytophthora boehmeriae TaxID=109152 RepID=A0A8T1WP06_9STRA|nr:hypothetical protein PHYBOEH_004170 [Phytophthora boehmeriae]
MQANAASSPPSTARKTSTNVHQRNSTLDGVGTDGGSAAFGGVLVTPEQIHTAFQFLDVEQKGRVTVDNLRARLGIFYDSMSAKDVRLLLSEEAELTEEYLQALLLSNEVKNFDPVAEAFKAYDPEETGFISREMLRYVFERLGYGALSEDDLNVLISCADADQDGRINLSDFRSMLQ